jgi:uncharacterized membrane protein
MHFRFLEPGFLWLLPLVALLWRWPVPIGQARRAFWLRAAALACVVLALARPVVLAPTTSGRFVVVVDASASARADGEALALLERGAGLAHTTLVRFGDADPVSAAVAERFDHAVDLGTTCDLATALEFAGALVPSGVPGAVAVASDGADREGAYARGAQALAARGLAVSFLALDARAFGPRPLGLAALGVLRAGHTARVRVHGLGAVANVQLFAAGELLAEAEPTLDGERFDALLEFEVPLQPSVELVATAGGASTRALLPIEDPLPVLYVGARTAGGAEALGDLLGPGFDVRPFTGAPSSGDETGDLGAAFAAALEGAPLVLVDDAPAERLAGGALEALANAVRARGTGFVMAGGSAAFGPGGYADTALEDLLPIDFVQREEKRDPSTTLVVIIDTSGSMGGERVQLAKEVARLAIQRLLPHDKVGIVEFYGAKRWAAPIQPASNHIELERAINRLDAGGGTVIMPAIEEAFYGLQNIDTRYKHVLVLTDGGVEQGAFEPLLRQMAEKGITVSTVLVGGTLHSEFLVDIANWGKGRFYSVPNRFNLPEILLKQPTSAQLPAYRTGSYAVDAHGGPVWWAGPRPDDVPPVDGYVESELRSGAEVLLSISETGQPLAATWMWGAGRTGAFMTEPTGAGTASFAAWPDYGHFLGRFLARCAAPEYGPFRFECERDGHEVRVVATALAPTDREPCFAGAAPAAATFERVAADRFEAAFAAADGAQLLELGHRLPGGPVELARRLVAPPRFLDEAGVDPSDALALERLALATGGRDLADGGQVSATTRERSRGVTRLAPFLAGLALLVFLLDVTLRRLPRRENSAAGLVS